MGEGMLIPPRLRFFGTSSVVLPGRINQQKVDKLFITFSDWRL